MKNVFLHDFTNSQNILKYNNLHKTQEKLAKIWESIGEFEEVKDLFPTISNESESCVIEEKKFHLVIVDCSKIGKTLDKISEQKKVTKAFELILKSFKELEKNNSILMENLNDNKFNIIFQDLGMAKRFKSLINHFSQDVLSTLEWTQSKSYKEFDFFFEKVYLAITMNSQLKTNEAKSKKLKI